MNNGQTQTPQGQPSQQAFFTAGEGNNPPEINPQPNNLEQSLFPEDIRNATEKQATNSNIGNIALGAPIHESEEASNATTPDSTPDILPLPDADPTTKLGAVFDLETPPLVADNKMLQKNPALNSDQPSQDEMPKETADEKADSTGFAYLEDGSVNKNDVALIKRDIEDEVDPAKMAEKMAAAREIFNKASTKEVAR